MTFREDSVNEFLELFGEAKAQINSFEGCLELELLRDLDNPSVFTTRSIWANKSNLEAYRNSEFFRVTWRKAKDFFADKPMAFSSANAAPT